MTPQIDFSMWPPALVFALIVIVLVTHVLPDVLDTTSRLKPSLPSSTAGKTATSKRGPQTSSGAEGV